MRTALLSVAGLIMCCQLAAAQQGLYISNSTHILYQKEGKKPTVDLDIIVAKPAGRIVGLAVDARNGYLFWSDVSHQQRGIYRARMNGAEEEKIVGSGTGEVNGLSVDWVSRHVYWTDALTRTISVADYDGRYVRVLSVSGIKAPRGIVADPINGWLYWNDQATRTIERSQLDGSNHVTIVSSGLYWPNQMTVHENKLYWLDGWNKTLYVCNFDGGGRSKVADFLAVVEDNPVFGLAIYRDTAYVSVWNLGRVFKVELRTGVINRHLLAVGYEALFGMAYYQLSLQQQGTNFCSRQEKHGCSHLCLPTTRTEGRCSCPSRGGLALYNYKNCIAPRELLLYALADEGEVGFVALDGDVTIDRYVISHSSRPIAVAYDARQQMVYWSDVKEKAIFKSKLDGSMQSVFMNASHAIGSIDGLVFDPVGRHLYFTNTGYVHRDGTAYWWHRIEMIGLDGEGRHVLVNTVSRPRGLWIHQDRYLYYTDWGETPGVHRVSLDGNEGQLVGSDFDNPNDVIKIGDTVYVVDSHHKTRTQPRYPRPSRDGALYRVAKDGLLKEVTGLDLKTPYAITAFKNTLYISDWERQEIVSVHPDTGDATPLLTHVTTPSGLAYSPAREYEKKPNPCELSRCDDACVTKASGQTRCVCSTYGPELLASDNQQCKEPEEFLLVANMADIRLVSLTHVTRRPRIIISGNSFFNNIRAVAFDAQTSVIYFANSGSIHKRPLIGGETTLVRDTGEDQIEALAIDGAGNSLFWTESNGHVASMTTRGDNYVILVSNVTKPGGIAYSKGQVYWSERGTTPRVMRKSVEQTTGSSAQLIYWRDLVDPSGVYIDDTRNLIYIGDAGTGHVTQCTVTGDKCTTLRYLAPSIGHLHSVWRLNDHLVYTDPLHGTVTSTSLVTGLSHVITTNLMRPSQLLVYGINQKQDCPPDHGCGDTCERGPGSYIQCVCSKGRSLNPDGKTCKNAASKWQTTDPSKCALPCAEHKRCAQEVGTKNFLCQCRPGYQPDGDTCTECTANYYKPHNDDSRCKPCPSGSSTRATGSDQCACPEGQVWSKNKEKCTESRDGTCPQCTRPMPSVSTSCSEDSDCSGLQKCCASSTASRSYCVDPVFDHGCTFNQSLYSPYAQFRKDPCTECRCNSGRPGAAQCSSGATCERTICPPVPCGILLKFHPGRCCPYCPSDPNYWGPRGQLRITNCIKSPVQLNLPDVTSGYIEFDPDIRYVDHQKRPMDKIKVERFPVHTMFRWKGSREEQEVRVVVRADDDSNNRDACKYSVIVQDFTKPNLTCPDNGRVIMYTRTGYSRVRFQVLADDKGSGLRYGHPVPTDPEKASGANFSLGHHVIEYRARDMADNEARCRFTITVEKQETRCDIPVLQNGYFTCRKVNKTVGCSAVCAKGFLGNPEFSDEFQCHGSKWFPQLPEFYTHLACIQLRRKSARLSIALYPSNTGFPPSALTEEFLYGVTAGAEREILPLSIITENNITVVIRTESVKNTLSSQADLVIKKEAHLEYSMPWEGEEAEKTITALYNEIHDMVNASNLVVHANGQYLVIRRTKKINITLGCRQGEQVLQRNWCFPCPAGMFLNHGRCVMCGPGTYQPRLGQRSCRKCPKGQASENGASTCTAALENLMEATGSLPMTYVIVIIAVVCAVVLFTSIFILIFVVLRRKMKKKEPPPEDNAALEIANPTYFAEEDVYDNIPADNNKEENFSTAEVGSRTLFRSNGSTIRSTRSTRSNSESLNNADVLY